MRIDDAPSTTVAIGVCTARRPRMLSDCLEAVRVQVIPDGCTAHLIVVDNDATPDSRQLVVAFAARCPFPVHLVHEPRRGIPQARNAILREAKRLGVAWIAMTDDDCRPQPNWLAALLEAAQRYEADVVYGRREFIFPTPPPYWIVGPGKEKKKHEEGEQRDLVATHNTLFSGRLAELQFNERLPYGEDMDFFYRAKASLSARIVYSAKPLVYEEVPRERATLWHQSKRRYYYAAALLHLVGRHKGRRAAIASAFRHIRPVPGAVLKLATAPLL